MFWKKELAWQLGMCRWKTVEFIHVEQRWTLKAVTMKEWLLLMYTVGCLKFYIIVKHIFDVIDFVSIRMPVFAVCTHCVTDADERNKDVILS